MAEKYVKTKYRGVFLRSGIAYIRYAVPGKKRGSVVWESTGQRSVPLAVERLSQRKTEIAEGRYFPNRRFEKASFFDLAQYWWTTVAAIRIASSNTVTPRLWSISKITWAAILRQKASKVS